MKPHLPRISALFLGILAITPPLLASETWWAFRPLADSAPPESSLDALAKNGIDRFVLSQLASGGLRPAPQADPATRLRRLHHDVMGLPPSREAIEAFLSDARPDAWQRRVDRLLASPRHGEHWASMWLHLVRYSESDGWNQDAYRPHIWRYRDYIVQAFNQDKPYPEFVSEQLAGDELPGDDPRDLAAAGFLRLGIYEYNQRDARGHWNDIMNEMTDIAGDVFLGVSLACARCHDHKFDPIPQRDYFKMRAFFEPVIWRDDLKASTDEERRRFQEAQATWEEATKGIREQIDALLAPYHKRKWASTVDKFPLDIQDCFHKPEQERTSWEHQMAYLVSRQFLEEGGGPLKSMSQDDEVKHEALKKALAAFDHLKPRPLPPVMTVSTFPGKRAPTHIPDEPGSEAIPPGFLTALEKASDPGTSPPPPSRAALAHWIASPKNPLTQRVIVNRLWQQHFGKGLVDTANDFGTQGEPPSHPALLDWLTHQFLDQGADFKKLHRLILTSATWQQSTHHPEALEHQKKDPNERWLWRAPVRRLSAEAIRDSMLSVSGELQQRVGGPSVDGDAPRRALYVKRFRNDNSTFLHAFDMPSGLKSIAQPHRTTTPTQSLTMINGPYTLARARAWAASLSRRHGDAQEAVEEALFSAWGRSPAPEEINASLSLLAPDAPLTPPSLADLCHVLFNSNEFLYLR